MEYYPNNTLTKYTTKLHNEISLQGEWEVGLSEMIFPRNWFNIGVNQFISITIYAINYPLGHPDRDDEISNNTPSGVWKYDYSVDIPIARGYYSDIGALVDELNKQLRLSGIDL